MSEYKIELMEKQRPTSRQKTCPQRVVVSASAESRHNGQVIASDGREVWERDIGGVAKGEVVPRGGILLSSVRRSAGAELAEHTPATQSSTRQTAGVHQLLEATVG